VGSLALKFLAWPNTFFYVSAFVGGTRVLPVGRVGSLTLIGPMILTGPKTVPLLDVTIVVVGADAWVWLDALVMLVAMGVFVAFVELIYLVSFFLRRGLAIAAFGLGYPTAVAAGWGVVVVFATTMFSSLPCAND